MDLKIGVIGGSGLGAALAARQQGRSIELDTPFGKPSAPIVESTWSGVPVAFLARHGIGHIYNPSQVNYRANIYALKARGCTHVIASGAVGSLQEQLAPRHLVLVDQFIDKTYRRQGTFFDDGLVVHAELAHPTCDRLRRLLHSCATAAGTTVHMGGTYVCMEGPQFSTRAESLLHRSWGGHLIGMTAQPEAKLCREAELAYALVALVTDYDCWRPHAAEASQSELLKEIIGHLHAATDHAIALITAAVEKIASTPADDLDSPAHRTLDLAVWSDVKQVPAKTIERYGVLLDRVIRARTPA